jgi:hypothetical protein
MLKQTPKESKTFKRHMAQLDTGYYPEGFIQGLRRAMHNRDRKSLGWSTSKSFSGMSSDEVDTLTSRISSEKPVITPEQSAKGLAWLMSKWKTPRGQERKRNPFNVKQQQVLENFRRFRLIGFEDISGAMMALYVPIYRVESLAGNSFDYYAAAWQSGGNGPEIIG